MITRNSIKLYFWLKLRLINSLNSIQNPTLRRVYAAAWIVILALAFATPTFAQESDIEGVGMRLVSAITVFGIVVGLVVVLSVVAATKEPRWGLLLVPLIVLGTIALAYQGASDQIEGEQELGGSLWDLVIDILTGV